MEEGRKEGRNMAENGIPSLEHLREKLRASHTLFLCDLAEIISPNRMSQWKRKERRGKTWPNWIETMRVSWEGEASNGYKKRSYLTKMLLAYAMEIGEKGYREIDELYVKDRYNNPKVYISENGVAGARKDSLDLDVQLNEACQVIYDARHLY
ncbi:hypothetical protein L3X38_043857 [Prunus dulcis]|uniref:Uncharacterized protein n=1 Tax=Prunus dulcis TaxID=3755 RepID=A0AAD4UZ17_PRUDU|nr:hypothetical protein L3X38_043857 [Prunus dulcis]